MDKIDIKKDINSIYGAIQFHENEIWKLRNELEKLQSSCEHDFEFSCSGPYEDCWVCKKCSKEEWM